jgi:hypothetical protein
LASLAIATGTVTALAAQPASASAKTPVNLMIELGGSANIRATYKQEIGTFTASVTYVAGGTTSSVTAGKVDLQRKLPGQHWKTVRTDSDPSTIRFGKYGSHSTGNMLYRLHYHGGTDGTTTWASGFSYAISVETTWNLHEKATCASGCRLYGKLSPRTKHQKIEIEVQNPSNGNWKLYEVVRSDSRSRWSAHVKTTVAGRIYQPVAVGSRHETTTTGEAYRFAKGPGLRNAAVRPQLSPR